MSITLYKVSACAAGIDTVPVSSKRLLYLFGIPCTAGLQFLENIYQLVTSNAGATVKGWRTHCWHPLLLRTRSKSD